MNMMAPNPLELVLMMLLGGGFGTPTGVPPTDEDPLVVRVAPADCLVYVGWSGTGTPDATSTNHSERLLAEPSVQAFLKVAQENIMKSMPSSPVTDQLTETQAMILGKPGAIFLSELKLNGDDPPTIRGGGLIRLDEHVNQFAQQIKSFQETAEGLQVEPIQVGSRTFSRLKFDPTAPTIEWGVAGRYLVVGIGEGAAQELMARGRQQPPQWLADIRRALPVDKVSSTLYVQVQPFVEMAMAQAGDPQAEAVMSALGLDQISSLANVSGVDSSGCVSRTLVGIEGEPRGILSLLDTESLNAGDFKGIPKDAPVAAAMKLDANQLFATWMKLAGQIDPGAAQQTSAGIQQLEQQLGINIQQDVLQSLGDTWRIYSPTGGPGLMNAWTVSISVRDRARLEATLNKLLAIGEVMLTQAGPGAPTLTRRESNGTTIHSLNLPMPGIPYIPSWCLTEDALVISAGPVGINAALNGAGGDTVAAVPALAEQLGGQNNPLAVGYVDTANVVRALLPFVQMGMQVAATQPGAPPMDTSNLPPAEDILRHLQPSLAVLNRSQAGIEFSTFQTMPGGNVGGSAPIAVALLLPAVQAAREAARRMESMNNLRQIGLAMHNHHAVHSALPAGYNADAQGKPLLSWRVHILPYIEEQALYEQFHLDEPWDSPHNKTLIAQMPKLYRSPNSIAEEGKTVYLGVVGADGIFVRPQPGMSTGTSFREVTDGTSATLMAVEAADESAAIWTQPADFAPQADNPLAGLLGLRQGGFLALMADGSVRLIAEQVDLKVLRGLLTKAGGELVQLP